MKDTEYFKIDYIDINKIRVSDKKLYSREHRLYKYYVFYKHDDKYIPLEIILRAVVGYCNDYKDNDKTINFKLDDDSFEKICDIFEYIEKKLEIDLSNFLYEDRRGEEYLKTKVSDGKYFRKNKDNKTNIIPNENTKYNCRVLLQIQSVYYSSKDKDILSDDNDYIVYYTQVLLKQYEYRPSFNSNTIVYPDIVFTDTEPEDNDESEPEYTTKNCI